MMPEHYILVLSTRKMISPRCLQFFKELLNATMPMLPYFTMAIVDVRDVVDAHVLALTHEKVPGENTDIVACYA